MKVSGVVLLLTGVRICEAWVLRSSGPRCASRAGLGAPRVISTVPPSVGGGSGGGFPRRPPLRCSKNDADDAAEDKDKEGEKGDLMSRAAEWWARDGKEDAKVYGVSLGLALLFRTFIMEPRFIPSLSMFPTFEINDQLAVEKISRLYRPYHRRDVVVFTPPPAFAEYSSRGTDAALIKRIVAVAGDEVQVRGGRLYINGQEQVEDFTFEEPEYEWGPMKVPAGAIMVLGDNRNHSLDSHIWGFLPTDNVIGRAVFRYWPPWRAGLVE
ncbi:unnamed protein product, partial [Phaeothamnion confervicola]